jgi:hypothetical protein
MQINVSDEEKAKADLPKVETRQSDSNVTLERAKHPEKQPLEMISIEEGNPANPPQRGTRKKRRFAESRNFAAGFKLDHRKIGAIGETRGRNDFG